MHDGRNAWTCVHVTVVRGAPEARSCSAAATRVGDPDRAPLRTAGSVPPGAVRRPRPVTARALRPDPGARRVGRLRDGARVGARSAQQQDPAAHVGERGVLPARGATEACLYRDAAGHATAVRPVLQAGDSAPARRGARHRAPGVAADADPAHRQVVQLEDEPDERPSDPALRRHAARRRAAAARTGVAAAAAAASALAPRGRARFPALPLARATPARARCATSRWRAATSSLADHGLRSTSARTHAGVGGRPPARLPRCPLRCSASRTRRHDPLTGRSDAAADLTGDVRSARPASPCWSTPDRRELGAPVPDLLDSPPFAPGLRRRGRTTTAVRSCASATASTAARSPARPRSTAVYRVGQRPRRQRRRRARSPTSRPPRPAALDRRGPQPAPGDRRGRRPRRSRRCASYAPAGVPRRAVPRGHRGRLRGRGARAARGRRARSPTFRWTGSWYTVFVGVDPRDPADLSRQPDGLHPAQPAPRAPRARVPHPLPARRLRPRDPAADDSCRSRSSWSSASRRTTSAATSRPGGGRRALDADRCPAAGRGFFHPDELHLRAARLPEPALRRRRGAWKAWTPCVVRTFSRYGQRERRRARDRRAADRAGRDRAARQRPELHRERRAPDRDARRQGVNDRLRLLRARRPADAAAVDNRPALERDRLPDRHLRELPRVDAARRSREAPELSHADHPRGATTTASP